MKKLLGLILGLMLAVTASAQNPTLVYPNNGLANTPTNQYAGKVTIGLNPKGRGTIGGLTVTNGNLMVRCTNAEPYVASFIGGDQYGQAQIEFQGIGTALPLLAFTRDNGFYFGDLEAIRVPRLPSDPYYGLGLISESNIWLRTSNTEVTVAESNIWFSTQKMSMRANNGSDEWLYFDRANHTVGVNGTIVADTADNNVLIGGTYFGGVPYLPGWNAQNLTSSVLIGLAAGQFMTNNNSVAALGGLAGQNSSFTTNSVYFGPFSGWNCGESSYSCFVGSFAGANAYRIKNSVLLGQSSGYAMADNQYVIAIGDGAASYAGNANDSIFIGANSGNYSAGASDSIFIGTSCGAYITRPNTLMIEQLLPYSTNAFGAGLIYGEFDTRKLVFNTSGGTTVNGPLTVTGDLNQIPISYSLPLTIISSSNWVTFAQDVVPAGKSQKISFVQLCEKSATALGADQVVRIYNVTDATTEIATNTNAFPNVTIPAGKRWYVRFENNSPTNITVSASVHGNLR